MASRNNRRATPQPRRASKAQVNIPRGTTARPPRTVGRPSPRTVSPYAKRDFGSAQPRVSTVKVGSLAQSQISRDARVNRSYRAHMAKVFVLLGVLAVLAAGVAGVYFSNLFSIRQVTVSGVEHLTSTEMTQLANVPSDTTLLRVDAGAIKNSIMRDAWVADVDVQRIFPETLNLAVTERAIGAVVEVSVDEGKSIEEWALSVDGMWLCSIPEEGSEAAAAISPKIYEDKAEVLAIKDVAYGVMPEVGTYCNDESIVNALDIVTGLTTDLKNQVKTVSATSTENTTITLDSNIEIAFGSADDIRDKERVCLQIMADHPGSVSYINVRVATSPTWRTT
ncbi:cell division protein FtsQ [Slackia faecicanis]|uniref:Cell division protein FtsQ n=1 Tax=Slackia faecicanis TaxID=255723 RepID=A0A3N0ADX2_9ACTN|nr:FtsQ-type POTRA domain-containing protein [Slackia faecicanis]RNL18417.1 cell division protein FtsQ [Slackia faecicanis]